MPSDLKPLPNPQVFYRSFPYIDLGDYVLRDMMLSDKHEYFNILGDERVNKYLSDEDIPKDAASAELEIKFWSSLFYRKLCVFWGIAEKKSNKLIGTIGFNSWSVQNRRTEVSYDLHPDYWRQGITSLALKKVIDFAFNKMAVTRIEARTMIDNDPSQRMLDKFKFQKEGVIRNYRVIRGEPTDIVQYSLIPEDVKGCDWITI